MARPAGGHGRFWRLAFGVWMTLASGLFGSPAGADGFASLSALGCEGTTGGEGGRIQIVSTTEAFIQAVRSHEPRILLIDGPIVLPGMVDVRSNKTLMGRGSRGLITGGGLNLSGVSNVIIQNLRFENSSDDAINIEDGSHHVWIDHCEFSRAYDGLIDIKKGADYITVSWNLFSDHVKTSLVGHSDTNAPQDSGKLRVTYHHNWFNGTAERHPRVRFSGLCHVYNNYYLGNTYGVASTMGANVLVEGNYFERVGTPTHVGYGSSGPGNLVERNNVFDRCLNPAQSGGSVPDPPYPYVLADPDDIPELVRAGAGRVGFVPPDLPIPLDLLYTAEVLPEASDPPLLPIGPFPPHAFLHLLPDPEIPDNAVLACYTPEDSSRIGWGLPWQVNPEGGVTIAFRIRWPDTLLVDRIFSIRMADGQIGEVFTLDVDGSCRLEAAGGEVRLAHLENWHTFRLTMRQGLVTVYLNEDPVPLFSGLSRDSSDLNAFAFGDFSKDETMAFLLDWLWVDGSGAYSPDERAIPRAVWVDRFSSESPHVVFVVGSEKVDPSTGLTPDWPLVTLLRGEGYRVSLLANPAQIPSDSESRGMVEAADLVVVGRSCASLDFAGDNRRFWNDLRPPLLLLQLYAARKSRLGWFSTETARHINQEGERLEALIEQPDDPVFAGLSLDEGRLPWCVSPYDLLDEVEGGNGTVMARAADGGSILFVRFDPSLPFYPDTPERPAGYRTLIGNGNDDAGWFHYDNFTQEARSVFLAEVARMVRLGWADTDTTRVGPRACGQGPVLILASNHPNPFNSQTWIAYRLLRPGRLVIRIFDCQGREVVRPMVTDQEAGDHRFLFDGANLGSGVYFYRIETNEGDITRKMLLLK